MICQHCGKVLDNDKLSFCVMCGYPLKGSKKGFFAKSEKTGISRAEDYAASQVSEPKPTVPVESVQPTPASAVQPPQQSVPQTGIPQTGTPVPQNPQVSMSQSGVPMMQQNPQMNMPQTSVPMMQQSPQMGMVQNSVPMMQQNPQMNMPQNGVPMMQQSPQMGMVQNGVPMMQQSPQMGIVQNGVMMSQLGMPQGTPFMQQMGMPMMQQNPQMGMMPEMGEPAAPVMGKPQMAYTMPQMQYGMPQFVGYDPTGNPMYMQTIPQLMGYDAYGNPIYTMVSVPCAMPQMQMPVMNSVAAVPIQPMPEQTAEVPEQAKEIPPSPELSATEEPNMETLEVTSAEEMPLSAESLMHEETVETEKAEDVPLPSEEELLDRIFSDTPKGYTMSSGTQPAAMTFSISLGANEITNVHDEDVTPSAEKTPKPKKKAAPKEEKKAVSKKKAPAKKATPIIVSPDDFFDDKPRKKRDEVDASELDKLDDAQLVEQLAAMETSKKKSHRTMKAATAEEMDPSNMVIDPAFSIPPQ